MRLFIQFWFTALLIVPSAFASNECSQLFAFDFSQHKNVTESQILAYQTLARSVTGPRLDVRSDAAQGMVELRRLFLAMGPGEFNAFWSTVSKKDVRVLTELVSNGSIPASELQLQRLLALDRFINDDKFSIFSRENPWDALQTFYPMFRAPGHVNNLGGVIGGVDTHAMTELQKEIIAAARGKVSRFTRGSFFRRLFHDPYFAAKSIVAFNDQIRLRLEYIDAVSTALNNEISDESNLKLTQDEIHRLKAMFDEIHKARKFILADLEKVYGQDITTGGYIVIPQKADLYFIASNIKKHNLLKVKRADSTEGMAEKIIAEMDQIFQTGRKRSNMELREEKDMDTEELRIRHRDFHRSSLGGLAKWDNLMERRTGHKFHIEYHYTVMVTKYRTVTRDGKTVTEPYQVPETRHGSDWIKPTYGQVFVNRLKKYKVGASVDAPSHSGVTIDSISGKKEILDETEALANVESVFYVGEQIMAEYQSFIEAHAEILMRGQVDPKLLQEHIDRVLKLVPRLDPLWEAAEKHSNLSDAQILALWSKEDVKFFRERNQLLKDTLYKISELLETYQEQFDRKDFELIVQADTVDQSRDFAWMMAKMVGKYAALGLTAVGGGGFTAMFLTNPEFHDAVVFKWEYLMMLLEGRLPGPE